MREAKQRKTIYLKRSKRINNSNHISGFKSIDRKELLIHLILKTQSPVKRRVQLSVGSNCKTSQFVSIKEWETFFKIMHSTLTERHIVLGSRQ